jgi:transposase
LVEDLLKAKVEARAIHRRLCRSHGYTGSYSSILRFIAQIRPVVPDAVVRIETAPGLEAQVDFGTVGLMWDPALRRQRTAYCFVMTLSWSRHMYVRFVFDQRIATWLQCHNLAFEAFGGVPMEMVIDNLKAAVLKASLSDPVLSEPYTRLARHCGFLVHPCRPHTPEHKGKVESGVHYVKRNFIASEEITDINDANTKVANWVAEEAGLRIHGTTYTRPMERFVGVERAALQPLPATPCDLEAVVRATLHRDCHVQVADAFYSAPHHYIGQCLDVYIHHHSENLFSLEVVQIFDRVTLLTTHERATYKGQRITRHEHYPSEKSLYLTRTRSWCQERAALIGPRCREIVDQLLADGPLDRLRGQMDSRARRCGLRARSALRRSVLPAHQGHSFGRNRPRTNPESGPVANVVVYVRARRRGLLHKRGVGRARRPPGCIARSAPGTREGFRSGRLPSGGATDMLTHPLLPKLKELRLSGMVDTLDERAQLAQFGYPRARG